MNAQDRNYLENMPEYQLYQKLLRTEKKLIELILTVSPEDEASVA
ncbi:hypothetical protein [Taibaiella koreensis]|nr:hypothetical protein [Taibaiella koreensis]